MMPACFTGLPPLARGAQGLVAHPGDVFRPTPAGAGSTIGDLSVGARRGAYPRWRGEHLSETAAAAAFDGLPPLARGARHRKKLPLGLEWPTPAGAGSTVAVSRDEPPFRAYPRWRGEHSPSHTMLCALIGLPPLARGARVRVLSFAVDDGPTPAGAGSTASSRSRRCWTRPTPAGAGSTLCGRFRSCSRWAYPRWRGEHDTRAVSVRAIIGLPPLARGAPEKRSAACRRSGPTPAGAGSTQRRLMTCSAISAYPRWRGEHCRSVTGVFTAMGLPPLARGAPPCRADAGHDRRPTPAGAGSTRHDSPRQRRPPAYPRWRGEHVVHDLVAAANDGLPPLARGAPAAARLRQRGTMAYPRWRGEHSGHHVHLEVEQGLPPLARGARCARNRRGPRTRPTPAGAGSTARYRRRRSPIRAYPRWRGEHCRSRQRSSCLQGLPPLARGAPSIRQCHSRETWPTPAGAGSTL